MEHGEAFGNGRLWGENWIVGVTDAIICFLRCVVLKKTVIRSEDLFAARVLGDSFGTL